MRIANIANIAKPKNLLYFPGSNIRYTAVPKNANSTVKATLLFREGVRVNPMNIHEIHRELVRPYACNETKQGRSLAVVRDPIRRFLSAFLDKIVANPRPAVWISVVMHSSTRLSLPKLVNSSSMDGLEIEKLTFLDFSRAVALIPDVHLDEHFRSQSWYLAGRKHDYMLSFDSPGWQRQLGELVGCEVVVVRPHGTQQYACPDNAFPGADTMTIGELRNNFQLTGRLPAAKDFLSPEAVDILRSRYKCDYVAIADIC
ncbi:MAG: sulfotransferase family protein [Chlorobium sp.]|nr:MAG: sulfotransferase family protein [Chlorobium sp.]